ELTATTAAGETDVFSGKLRDGYLILDYTDPASQDVQRLKMNSAGDGARFIYTLERKRSGRTLFAKDIQVECSKEGESLAGGSGRYRGTSVPAGPATAARGCTAPSRCAAYWRPWPRPSSRRWRRRRQS